MKPQSFLEPATSYVNTRDTKRKITHKSTTGKLKGIRKVGSSGELTGIELRLLPPYITENGTKPFLFFPGFASLYCITIVVSDVKDQLVGGIDIQAFPRIGDEEHLPVNKTIFYWQQDTGHDKAPSQVHTFVSVIKSRKGVRDTGKIMSALGNDEDYKSITGKLAKLAKTTVTGSVIDIVTRLAGIVGKYLGDIEDKPLGTVINSYTALYGDFDAPGIQKRTYPTKNVNFQLELIVRDAEIDPLVGGRKRKKSPIKIKVTKEKKTKTTGTTKVPDKELIPIVDLIPFTAIVSVGNKTTQQMST